MIIFDTSFVDGYKESHTFNFSKYLSLGVTSAIYHPKYNLLLVSSNVNSADFACDQVRTSRKNGISAWTLLTDDPYYRLSLTETEERQLVRIIFIKKTVALLFVNL